MIELWVWKLVVIVFAVDMGVYHTTGANPRVPVVPDAFLSLGVDLKKGEKSRRSYITWEEQGVVPMFALEMVSHQPGVNMMRNWRFMRI